MKKNGNRTLKDADTTLYARIRELILSARQTVARGINLVQVYTNFEIGRHIIDHEQQGKGRAAYGQKVVGQLAERLTEEFGGGYSRRNLELMRQFFVLYSDRRRHIAQSLTAQLSSSVKTQSMIAQSLTGKSAKPDPFTLSWTHYVFLLGVKNPDERRFYEIEAAGQNWSLRELKRQFNTGLYERLALSRDKKGIRRLAKKGQIVETPQDMLKEPYVLEFLGLDESAKYSETELETAIINKLEHFLLELGKGFLFEARQKRFTFDEDHFFVDLVFYNRLLRCYVLIDLKIGKLMHQDLGQMQMYVNYFDRHVRQPGENRTVGIILCSKKKDALVEITLPKDSHIRASEYQLYLPSKVKLKQKLMDWTREQEAR